MIAQGKKKVDALLETAWEKKRKELGLKIINCKKPFVSNLEKQQAAVDKLKKASAQNKKPISLDEITPASKADIKRDAKDAAETKFEEKLFQVKRKAQERMDKQLEGMTTVLKKEVARNEAVANQARDQLEKHKPA